MVAFGISLLVGLIFSSGKFIKNNPYPGGTEEAPALPGNTSKVLPTSGRTTELLSTTKTKNRVFMPVSIAAADEGGASVLEIDHGLRKVGLTIGESYSEDVINAQQRGADAAITFRVVDSRGQPVQGATVKGAFWNGGKKGFGFNVETDVEGLVSLRNRCVGDLNFSISKENHYDTTLRYWFFKNGYDCVKDGRWMPWNPTVEVVLKEKRNPARMHIRTVEIPMPAYDEPVGFDLEVGDWVSPHGKGNCTDVAFEMRDEFRDHGNQGQIFRMLFTNGGDGIIRKRKDTFSEFPADHEAPIEGYQSELTSQWRVENGRMVEDSRIKEGDYLVFRFRSRTDADGNLIEARYGKLYGLLEYSFGTHLKRRIHFTYYLNPNANDLNLEAEGRHP